MEVELNDTNFNEEVLKSELPVLVDFWAPWCGPCSMVAPIVEEIAKEYTDKLKVCKLNVDEGAVTASKYEIRGIPTLAIFKDGKIVETIVGAIPKSQIEDKLRPHI